MPGAKIQREQSLSIVGIWSFGPAASLGQLRKLGKKSGIAEKEMDEAENDVYDTGNEDSPLGTGGGILWPVCVRTRTGRCESGWARA